MPALQGNRVLSRLGIVLMFSVLLLSILIRGPKTMERFRKIYEEDPIYSDVLGIELGRGYSRIAVMRNSTLEIIPDKQGRTAIPNYVTFQNNGPILVGDEAQTQALVNPRNTIYDFRRLMGRKFDNHEIQEAIKDLPYSIVNLDGMPAIEIIKSGIVTHYTPENITTLMLEMLKAMAETYLNTTIRTVIVSVPLHFDDRQKEAVRTAAVAANLDVFRFASEPVAITMAYGVDIFPFLDDVKYFMCNLNANEYDLTILEYDRGVTEIMGTVGERDFTWEDIVPGESSQTQTIISSISQTSRILKQVNQLLIDTKMTAQDLGGIMITGHSTHLSELQLELESHFPDTKILDHKDFKPDEAILRGVAQWGARVSGWPDDYGIDVAYILDVVPVSLGFELSNGGFMKVLPRNTVMPTRRTSYLLKNSGKQKIIVVKIYEGERGIAGKNNLLCTLELDDSSTWWKKEHQIELVFEVDANGVLLVTLGIKGDAKTVRQMLGPREYTQEDIDNLLQEVEEFREADLKQLEANPPNISDGVNLLKFKNQYTDDVATTGVREWMFGWL